MSEQDDATRFGRGCLIGLPLGLLAWVIIVGGVTAACCPGGWLSP